MTGNALMLGQGGTATGAFSLSAPAKDVKVAVSNAAGNIVAVLDLGAMTAGSQNFTWNGQSIDGTALPAGTYTFNVVPHGPAEPRRRYRRRPIAVVPVTSVVLGGAERADARSRRRHRPGRAQRRSAGLLIPL